MATRALEGVSKEGLVVQPDRTDSYEALQEIYQSEKLNSEQKSSGGGSVEQAAQVPLPEDPVPESSISTDSHNDKMSAEKELLVPPVIKLTDSSTGSVSEQSGLQRSYSLPLRARENLDGTRENSVKGEQNSLSQQEGEPYEELVKEYRELVETPRGEAALESIKQHFIEHRLEKANEIAEHFDERLSCRAVLRMAELNRDLMQTSGLAKTEELSPVCEKLDEIIAKLGSNYQNFRDITHDTMRNCIDLGVYIDRRAQFDASAGIYTEQINAGKNYGLGGDPDGRAYQLATYFAYSSISAPQKSEYSYNSGALYDRKMVLETADLVKFQNLAEGITRDIREDKFSSPLTSSDPPLNIKEIVSSTNDVEEKHLDTILRIWEKIDNLGPEAFHHSVEKYLQDNLVKARWMREEVKDLLQDQITLSNFLLNKLREQTQGKGKAVDREMPGGVSSVKDSQPIIREADALAHLDGAAKRAEKYVKVVEAAVIEVLRGFNDVQHDSLPKGINALTDRMLKGTIKHKWEADKSKKAIDTERRFVADRSVRTAIKTQYAVLLSGGLFITVGVGIATGIATSKINQAGTQKKS